jgi:two-component system, OmpR family, response regulator CpxR
MRPKKHVLCIDSNPATLSVRACLLSTRGYRVTEACGAEEAQRLFHLSALQGGVRFDAVVCTLTLDPDCDGEQLARTLKRISAEVPIILLSQHTKDFACICHADAFLGRTSTPADLIERLRIMVQRKGGPRKQPVSVSVAEAAPVLECAG